MARAKKKSAQDVADIIDMEGMGYALEHYLSADSIADKKLAALWQTAADAIAEIEDFLDEAGVERESDYDDDSRGGDGA